MNTFLIGTASHHSTSCFAHKEAIKPHDASYHSTIKQSSRFAFKEALCFLSPHKQAVPTRFIQGNTKESYFIFSSLHNQTTLLLAMDSRKQSNHIVFLITLQSIKQSLRFPFKEALYFSSLHNQAIITLSLHVCIQ